MPKKVKAVRLALGAAAECWHSVAGLPGHYHPAIPVPLDQPGLITGEQARAFLAAHSEKVAAAAGAWETFRADQIQGGKADIGPFATPGAPVELVDLDERLADEHAMQAREQLASNARALAAARRRGEGDAPNAQNEANTGPATTPDTGTGAAGGE